MIIYPISLPSLYALMFQSVSWQIICFPAASSVSIVHSTVDLTMCSCFLHV